MFKKRFTLPIVYIDSSIPNLLNIKSTNQPSYMLTAQRRYFYLKMEIEFLHEETARAFLYNLFLIQKAGQPGSLFSA